jgi:hypothetical protein
MSQIAQQTGHLARGSSPLLRLVRCGIHSHDGFGDEIQDTLDLTMPETPTDPFDRLGEASTGPDDPSPSYQASSRAPVRRAEPASRDGTNRAREPDAR